MMMQPHSPSLFYQSLFSLPLAATCSVQWRDKEEDPHFSNPTWWCLVLMISPGQPKSPHWDSPKTDHLSNLRCLSHHLATVSESLQFSHFPPLYGQASL